MVMVMSPSRPIFSSACTHAPQHHTVDWTPLEEKILRTFCIFDDIIYIMDTRIPRTGSSCLPNLTRSGSSSWLAFIQSHESSTLMPDTFFSCGLLALFLQADSSSQKNIQLPFQIHPSTPHVTCALCHEILFQWDVTCYFGSLVPAGTTAASPMDSRNANENW